MYYYINIFFLYSILGHIIETLFYTIGSGESGILYGYWTPVYGIGAAIILLFYNLFLNKKYNGFKKYLYLFLFSAISLTGIEWLGGVLIEKIFGVIFWSYENLPFNIGDYISIEMALVWGVASLLIVFLRPFFDYIEKKIPRFITWIMMILFIIDLSVTIYFKAL